MLNLSISLSSQDASLKDIVLSILTDYYKSCDHSADARISILELIEQVSAIYFLSL